VSCHTYLEPFTFSLIKFQFINGVDSSLYFLLPSNFNIKNIKANFNNKIAIAVTRLDNLTEWPYILTGL